VAVLAHWPAALTGMSALPLPPARAVVDVAIADNRTVKPVAGVWAHRTPALDERVDWRCAPPRMRIEHAVIDVASARRHDVLATFRLLADVVQTKRTTALQVAEVLLTRRVPGRTLLLEMLGDLATGACSVLEREYLHRVERAHGLPEGERQAPGTAGGRKTARDVHYVEHRLLLDARVGEGVTTVRLTYGLVLGTPCWTASRVYRLLRRGGWTGDFVRCPSCPRHLDL
jgi:hypothetical protein